MVEIYNGGVGKKDKAGKMEVKEALKEMVGEIMAELKRDKFFENSVRKETKDLRRGLKRENMT